MELILLYKIDEIILVISNTWVFYNLVSNEITILEVFNELANKYS